MAVLTRVGMETKDIQDQETGAKVKTTVISYYVDLGDGKTTISDRWMNRKNRQTIESEFGVLNKFIPAAKVSLSPEGIKNLMNLSRDELAKVPLTVQYAGDKIYVSFRDMKTTPEEQNAAALEGLAAMGISGGSSGGNTGGNTGGGDSGGGRRPQS